jgi:SHS2 domain-containing protein
MPYKFLEDVTYADVAFEARGNTLSELFREAALAVFESMANTQTVKPEITKEITLNADTLERLLFEFLEEIVVIKDIDVMVFHNLEVAVDEGKKSVHATLYGDKINHAEQELHQDVKAVTMHYFKVEKQKEWAARVVLDI